MKISDVNIHVLKADLSVYWFLQKVPSKVYFALIRVLTDEGVEGDFITSTEPTGTGLDSLVEEVKSLKPILVGSDPFDRERIMKNLVPVPSQKLYRALAVSAIDIALWDIAGKVTGFPIYKLMGAYREKIKAYASATPMKKDITVQDIVNEVLELKRRGYTAYKLHPWGIPEKDLAACRAVREAVGDSMILMHDPMWVYDRRSALVVGRELEKLDFYWYEAPIPHDDISGYVELTRLLDIPIAVEMWDSYSEYIRRGAIDIFRAMGDVSGGITDMRKSADLCELSHIKWEPHCYGSTLCQAAHLHVILTTRNCDFFEMPVPDGVFDVGMKEVLKIDKEGYVHAPTKPGLGLEIDWKKIEELTLKKV